MALRNKAARLSDPTIHELSLVFAQKDGSEWAPRNPESRATVKAAAAAPREKDAKKAFLVELVEKIKGWYTDGPVVGGTTDKIDNDGDGDADYNTIVALFTSMYYDMQNAIYIADDAARSAAVVALVDGFLRQLDAIRAGDETADAGKAGARHSAADKASITAITDAHAKLGKALDAANKAHDAIGDGVKSLGGSADDGTDTSTKDDASKAAALAAANARKAVAKAIAEKSGSGPTVNAGELGEDGLPVNYAELLSANGASDGG